MSADTTTRKAPAKGTGPLVPAGEPRPGPLLPPEQPSPPSAPTPAEPGPEPDPMTEREAALAEVRRQVTAGEVGIGALLRDLTPQQVRDEALDLMAEAGLAAEPQRDDHPLTVHEAIAEVTRRIGSVAKTAETTGGERFKYRGIDDLLVALHPILAEVGLVLLPGEVVERERETRQTARGGTLNVCHLRVRYTLVGPDGSWLPGEAWGEAGDSGDKATQKAHSQSYKSFVFQTFSVPTADSARDEPDAVHEVAASWTPEQRQRAAAAWGAGRQADNIGNLVAVRQHALSERLLDVPVAGADGDTPLGVLLDQRRAEVERAVPTAEQPPA